MSFSDSSSSFQSSLHGGRLSHSPPQRASRSQRDSPNRGHADTEVLSSPDRQSRDGLEGSRTSTHRSSIFSTVGGSTAPTAIPLEDPPEEIAEVGGLVARSSDDTDAAGTPLHTGDLPSRMYVAELTSNSEEQGILEARGSAWRRSRARAEELSRIGVAATAGDHSLPLSSIDEIGSTFLNDVVGTVKSVEDDTADRVVSLGLGHDEDSSSTRSSVGGRRQPARSVSVRSGPVKQSRANDAAGVPRLEGNAVEEKPQPVHIRDRASTSSARATSRGPSKGSVADHETSPLAPSWSPSVSSPSPGKGESSEPGREAARRASTSAARGLVFLDDSSEEDASDKPKPTTESQEALAARPPSLAPEPAPRHSSLVHSHSYTSRYGKGTDNAPSSQSSSSSLSSVPATGQTRAAREEARVSVVEQSLSLRYRIEGRTPSPQHPPSHSPSPEERALRRGDVSTTHTLDSSSSPPPSLPPSAPARAHRDQGKEASAVASAATVAASVDTVKDAAPREVAALLSPPPTGRAAHGTARQPSPATSAGKATTRAQRDRLAVRQTAPTASTVAPSLHESLSSTDSLESSTDSVSIRGSRPASGKEPQAHSPGSAGPAEMSSALVRSPTRQERLPHSRRLDESLSCAAASVTRLDAEQAPLSPWDRASARQRALSISHRHVSLEAAIRAVEGSRRARRRSVRYSIISTGDDECRERCGSARLEARADGTPWRTTSTSAAAPATQPRDAPQRSSPLRFIYWERPSTVWRESSLAEGGKEAESTGLTDAEVPLDLSRLTRVLHGASPNERRSGDRRRESGQARHASSGKLSLNEGLASTSIGGAAHASSYGSRRANSDGTPRTAPAVSVQETPRSTRATSRSSPPRLSVSSRPGESARSSPLPGRVRQRTLTDGTARASAVRTETAATRQRSAARKRVPSPRAAVSTPPRANTLRAACTPTSSPSSSASTPSAYPPEVARALAAAKARAQQRKGQGASPSTVSTPSPVHTDASVLGRSANASAVRASSPSSHGRQRQETESSLTGQRWNKSTGIRRRASAGVGDATLAGTPRASSPPHRDAVPVRPPVPSSDPPRPLAVSSPPSAAVRVHGKSSAIRVKARGLEPRAASPPPAAADTPPRGSPAAGRPVTGSAGARADERKPVVASATRVRELPPPPAVSPPPVQLRAPSTTAPETDVYEETPRRRTQSRSRSPPHDRYSAPRRRSATATPEEREQQTLTRASAPATVDADATARDRSQTRRLSSPARRLNLRERAWGAASVTPVAVAPELPTSPSFERARRVLAALPVAHSRAVLHKSVAERHGAVPAAVADGGVVAPPRVAELSSLAQTPSSARALVMGDDSRAASADPTVSVPTRTHGPAAAGQHRSANSRAPQLLRASLSTRLAEDELTERDLIAATEDRLFTRAVRELRQLHALSAQ